jgi:hypothetical protein
MTEFTSDICGTNSGSGFREGCNSECAYRCIVSGGTGT